MSSVKGRTPLMSNVLFRQTTSNVTNKTFKLLVSYDGSNFYGSQIQKDKPTVAGFLATAVKKVLKKEIKLIFASRTDRGVHARENVCSFSSETNIPVPSLKKALNSKLPKYIRVNKIAVKNNFNPRYDCKSKVYRYYFRTGDFFPYQNDYCLCSPFNLNRRLMHNAAKLIEGQKDFKYLSSCSNRKNTICEIKQCRLSRGKNLFFLEIEGSHFLYKMVRTIVSFIIEVGSGKIKTGNFERIICGKAPHITPAPPNGLYLWKIKYK